MDSKKYNAFKISAAAVCLAVCLLLTVKFSANILSLSARVAVFSAARYLPTADVLYSGAPAVTQSEKTTDSGKAPDKSEQEQQTTEKETTTKKAAKTSGKSSDFYTTPDDIIQMMETAKKNSAKDKEDGKIYEMQYTNEGVTDKYGNVKIKNTNKTKVSVKSLLEKQPDMSVDKSKPAVLIYHTHTTESYQYIDRDFYAQGYVSRNTDETKNMVRVGDAICEQLEEAGFTVIHDKTIYDSKYNGAYERSRASVISYLKKYPSIGITLDIHRDAIQQTNGVKIKPTAVINGKKAAQVMIISGCQEDGNGIEDFPDWRFNLIFAAHLQKRLEDSFPGITRPIFFSPRRYNMHLTHCSLLLEIGSDSNTLEEAFFTGRCVGKALAQLMLDNAA